MYLVTASGEQFGVGLAATMGEISQALSPDGRWFAQRRDGQWWIRDLTGVTERAVPPGYELRQWSTDGRALLLGQPCGAGEAYAAFTLPGGELRPLALRGTPGRRMLAFLHGRELATAEFNVGPKARPRRQLTIAIQASTAAPPARCRWPPPNRWAPATSATRSPRSCAAAASRRRCGLLSAGGRRVPTGKPEGALTVPPMTLVGVDLRSGRPAGRTDLVVPRGGEGENPSVPSASRSSRDAGSGTAVSWSPPTRPPAGVGCRPRCPTVRG